MFDDYETSRGEPPDEDVEPTAEKLGAIHQLIA
jgi:hypothetical protein